MSLFPPRRHQSFLFNDDNSDREDEKDMDKDAHNSEAKGMSLRRMEFQGCTSVIESKDN